MVLETIFEFAYFEFNTFAEERALFMREISSGLYSTKAYCISKLCSKVCPLNLFKIKISIKKIHTS